MNTETPTPRTDARMEWIKKDLSYKAPEQVGACIQTYLSLLVGDCRQLERELLAVTKERDEAKQACSELDLKLGQAEADLAAARTELAEAQKELEIYAWGYSPAMAEAKIDQLNAQIKLAASERDAALAEVADAKQKWLDKADPCLGPYFSFDDYMALQDERDQLRAECDRLHPQLEFWQKTNEAVLGEAVKLKAANAALRADSGHYANENVELRELIDKLRVENERLRAHVARLVKSAENHLELDSAETHRDLRAAMSAGFKPSNDGVKQP